jgi:kumamolisin
MPGRKMFPNSVVPLPSTPGLTTQGLIVSAAEPKHRADMMQLHFSLAPPEALQQELEDRVAKGEVIPIDEQEKKYGADAASAKALVAWLKSEGFKVSHVTPDHTTIYASAPVSQVETSLGVHTVRVTRDGQTYTAASDVPSLPNSVAANVMHIGGCSRSCTRTSTAVSATSGRPKVTKREWLQTSPMHRLISSPRS